MRKETKIYLLEKDTYWYTIHKVIKVTILLCVGICIGLFMSSIANAEEYRNKTYNKPNEWDIQKVPFWNFIGGKSLHDMQLYTLVDSVLQRLTFLDHSNPNLRDLCVETIITESNGGYYIIGAVSKSDLGLAQIQLATAIDTLEWLDNFPKQKREVLSFLDKGSSLTYNLKYNAPFSVAMMVTYYWRMGGSNFYSKITSVEDRALLWKTKYNTHLGKGTPEKYIARVDSYIGNLF